MLRLLDVLCGLFCRALCTICGPHAQTSIFFEILLKKREHLIYIYNEYVWLTLTLLPFQRI